jgi:hypothetical protein
VRVCVNVCVCAVGCAIESFMRAGAGSRARAQEARGSMSDMITVMITIADIITVMIIVH